MPVEFREQQREGDCLTKDERYERTRECMQIVRAEVAKRDAALARGGA